MVEKVRGALERFRELEQEMAAPETVADPSRMETLGKEYAALARNMPVFEKYLSVLRQRDETRQLIATEQDPEMLALAREELAGQEHLLPELEDKVKVLLVPPDPTDSKNAVVEIRWGTGGVEAGIFAADLYSMYAHYCESKKWRLEVLSSSYGELGSIKEIIFSVSGQSVYGRLKHESGVHRVQRIPRTESQGRIHTSAASVAVLPEADQFEVAIEPSELRIDVYRSSGPGGQSVNTTDSAVRIVHIPTGLTVTCQDEKSQHKNKAKAVKVLASRLYDMKLREREDEETARRRSMVGSGDRSEKVRTYNYPQGRVTDHRIGLSLYKLESIMGGDLDELIEALVLADVNERLRLR